MNQNVLCKSAVTQNESVIDYQNKNQSALKIEDDKILEIVKTVLNNGFNKEQSQGGIHRLRADTKTLFGINVGDNMSCITHKNTIELLFHYLMSFKVPPTEVNIWENVISLYWYPTGKLEVKNNGEYIDLLIQFQEYIDSFKLMDLVIDFDVLEDYPPEDYYTKESLHVEFTEKTFSYYHGKEIMFIELQKDGRGENWLEYDSNGKVITSTGEALE